MPRSIQPARTALLLCLAWLCTAARADGPAELRAALQRLQGQAPLKAAITARTQHRQGEGSEAEETQGLASLLVDDGPQGLRVQYAQDTLARVRAEDAAKDTDASARAPTVAALNALGYREIRELTSAAESLGRQLARATFKAEYADTWAGRPARRLNFELGLGKLPPQQQKYVRSHEGTLDVWIAADGTPLASRSNLTVAGRALVVISFEQRRGEEVTYAVLGDRLVATRKDTRQSGTGGGESGADHIELTLAATGS